MGLPRVTRSAEDDYRVEPVARRRALCEQAAGRGLPHIAGRPVPLEEARNKVENLIGHAQIPLGIAGPLHVDTSAGPREVYVPLATTEGAMVASYSRGMRLLGRAARSRVQREGLTQNPILVYRDAAAALEASRAARDGLDEWRAITGAITHHGRLDSLQADVVGRRLLLRLQFFTGDAIGINLAARATDRVTAELARRSGALERYVHGQDVEKRANSRALIEGRGRSVVCDAVVPRAALAEQARTTPEALAAIGKSYAVGFHQLGTHNGLVQAANGLAGLMLACGQDVAYLPECATGWLDLEVTPEGDLHAAATLPSLILGTVGGGTGQGTAAECLALLGCQGAGSANLFAEIAAAVVLAGDLSLMAAFCSHEFVEAHERLGRNRPASG